MSTSAELMLRTNFLDLASSDHVLGVMFPKSKANAYQAVVAICKRADGYAESDADGLLYHCATFGKSADQITRALSVVNYSSTITAAMFFAKGLPIVDTHYLYESLKCYVQSLACDDRTAHCHRIISEPRIGSGAYLFPCNYMIKRQARLDLNAAHPSTMRNQIQALAVDLGCSWCPNFKPESFRKA